MSANIEIFTKFACPYCYRAKALLDSKGVAYIERDASGGAAREDMLARSNGRTTVPQIFIDGHHVGGSDDLMALEAAGNLDPMLAGNR
ncbi:MAG: glutaredoxin 3 [Sphingomonadales bacterium]|jgi:glutaredoxin 3|nr:glutaredoxin 3 [Sphingomonadales bacterium]MBK9004294.1 glutaredoxin 3 [Sphingomonadales bacterium]MBK9269470.1 glutaredoxin 3 [Sphingomonadales bacterium]MBP6433927.1 glutaredoxin 3 [Sphingorhabdus sp.]